MSVHKQILQNNVMLITQELPEHRIASMGFWFSVGSRNEQKGEYGITHFIEHLLFKGTSEKSARELSLFFDKAGGYVNAYTDRENVCVYCTIPVSGSNVKNAMHTLCDMSCHAVFPEQEVQKERTVVENEISSSLDDAEGCAMDAAAACVWPNQNISRSITGSIADVENLTREQIVHWYESYFVFGELTVVCVGNFRERDLVEELSLLPVHAVPKKYPNQRHYNDIPVWTSGRNYIPTDFTQLHLIQAYPVDVPFSPKSDIVLDVFNALAGDTMSSRLFQVLRESNGLCYNVYSFVSEFEDAALWSAYASCDKANGKTVAHLLQHELERFVHDDFSDEEIEAAKEHLCGEEIINSEDVEYIMKRIHRNYSLGFPFFETDDIIRNIRLVTKDDIVAFVKKILDKKNCAFVAFGASSQEEL
ncbi:MAG: insulinase family protein [Treponema sp.]|nr:insulinase family protein [Treponema sp.]